MSDWRLREQAWASPPKKRVVREEDKDVLPSPWILMELPQIEVNDTTKMGPHMCKILFGLKDPDIWMEFSAMNLLYFKTMICLDHQKGIFGRTRVKQRRMSPRKSPISPKGRRGLKRQLSGAKSPVATFPVTSPEGGTEYTSSKIWKCSIASAGENLCIYHHPAASECTVMELIVKVFFQFKGLI